MSTAKPLPSLQPIPYALVPVSESVAKASWPMFDWWLHHWMDASHPVARMQQVWMESVIEAVQVEAEFLNACAVSSEKMSKCFTDPEVLHSPASLSSCYHEVAKDMADAHASRLGKVADLPKDFRQRLWEEIC